MQKLSITVLLATLGCTECICQAQFGATGIRHLVQAFAGFNQPNDFGTPCASPCFASPAGTVVVQPNHFVSSNSAGIYYAVFQADGWIGDLSTTFELSEAGSVVQTLTITGSISAKQAHSAVVLSGNADIPQSSFVGLAALTATTTATPDAGGAGFTLKSSSQLQVGAAGTRRVVQVFAGISSSNGGTGYPCTPPECPLQIPPGSVAVQPNQFQGPGTDGAYYAVFQAEFWQGVTGTTCQVMEAGEVVYTILDWEQPTGSAMSLS